MVHAALERYERRYGILPVAEALRIVERHTPRLPSEPVLTVEATGRVGGERAHAAASDAEHGERLDGARVHVAAAENRDERERRQSFLLDVDTVLETPPPPGWIRSTAATWRGD